MAHQKSATRLSDIEIENSKLRETLAEYNSEFAEVKSQGRKCAEAMFTDIYLITLGILTVSVDKCNGPVIPEYIHTIYSYVLNDLHCWQCDLIV